MRNNASLVYNFVVVLADITALVVGFTAAFLIRAASPIDVAHPVNGGDYLLIMLGLLPFWIIIFALLGLYHHNIYERRFPEIARLFAGSFIGLMFLVFWDYMQLEHIFPAKLVPIYGFLIAFVLLVIFRNLLRWFRVFMFRFGYGLTRIALIGNTPITKEIALSVVDSRKSGYELAGVIGYRKNLPDGIKTFPNLETYVRSDHKELHGIVQTELYANEARNDEVLSYAQQSHIGYRFVPGNTELLFGDIDVELFRNSIPVIHVRHTALFGWGRIIKRLTDITLSAIGLVVASPLFLIIYLLEKLTGSKKAVFSQTRLTRFGTPFKVYKFRTQYEKYDGTTPEEAFDMMGKPELAKEYRKNGDSLDNDPRITKLGRFLRATSLDELPQLWNVLRGDISLVGPRALIPQELKDYGRKHIILNVKSGLTGLAVVSGRRDISYEERRKLDVFYVQNWSFWLDVTILLKTIRLVVSRIGAK